MEEKKLEFRGGRAMALVPFVIFIVVTIGLSFANFQDIDAMVTAGMIALLIGLDKPAMSITGSGAHGINGATPEDTMRNMGLIASPGMVQTEKTIVEIFENKLK